MRLLLPLVSIPILIYGRSAWACGDHDSDADDDDGEAEEAEAPEPPDPPDPPEAAQPVDPYDAVASAEDGNDVDIDIHWDIDVRWKDHDDGQRSQARRLVIDRLEDLEQQLDAATSDLDDDED